MLAVNAPADTVADPAAAVVNVPATMTLTPAPASAPSDVVATARRAVTAARIVAARCHDHTAAFRLRKWQRQLAGTGQVAGVDGASNDSTSPKARRLLARRIIKSLKAWWRRMRRDEDAGGAIVPPLPTVKLSRLKRPRKLATATTPLTTEPGEAPA